MKVEYCILGGFLGINRAVIHEENWANHPFKRKLYFNTTEHETYSAQHRTSFITAVFPHKADQGFIVPELSTTSDFSQCKAGANQEGCRVAVSPLMRNVKSEYRWIFILSFLFFYLFIYLFIYLFGVGRGGEYTNL